MFQILDQTSDFVVIDKAPGVSVHKDQEDAGLTMLLQQALGLEKIYLVHRLDKVTSGLMVFALTAPAAAQLAELFRCRTIKKYYLAVSAEKPKRKQGLIAGDMEKSRRASWKLIKSRKNPAISQFFSTSLKPGYRLFLLKPSTGKTHQLRVALKSEGAPILGDQLYGGQRADRTYLHAYALSFNYNAKEYNYLCAPHEGEHFDEHCSQVVHEAFAQPAMMNWPKIPGNLE